MKIFVLSPDAAGQIDGSINRNLLSYLPQASADGHGLVTSDAVLIPISWFPNFKLAGALPNDKPWILLDFMEPHTPSAEYDKFWQWVSDNPPILTLKRELRQSEVTDRVKPVEFPCYLDIPPTQSRSEFEARPLEVFSNWGYSNISRPFLHAEIFRAMAMRGIEVIDSFEGLEKRQGTFPKRTWASIYTHHSMRRPIAEIMRWQQQAKISVSLPGNGVICFRSTEAPVGSIVAHLNSFNGMARSYEWIGGVNCIHLNPEHPFDSLNAACSDLDLYPIYVACQETIRKYVGPTYVREYVLKQIEAAL